MLKEVSRRFTLIELLIVIAVILILLSLIQPALNRTIELAKRTVCVSNLKQWGLIYNGYADDNYNANKKEYEK